LDYGFRVVIAPSFADIFYSNSFKNGILLIKLDANVIDDLFNDVSAIEGYELNIDLESQTITKADGEVIQFDVDEFRKKRLLNGLDDIGLKIQHTDDIKAYEQSRRQETTWLFN